MTVLKPFAFTPPLVMLFICTSTTLALVTSGICGTYTLICQTPGNCGESPENWTGCAGYVSLVECVHVSTKQAPMNTLGTAEVEVTSLGPSPSAGGLATIPWP